MLKTIAVLALLCAAVQAEVKLNFTKEYELIMNEPHFFKSGEEVIAVEYGEELIKTSSSDVNAKKCEIEVDKKVHHIDTKMMDQSVRSWILGNGKIVLMGPRNTNESDNFNHYHIYVVHVIDPVACTKLSFTRKVAVPKEQLPYIYGILVPYQDTFDLFFLDSPESKCFPCRFNDKAEEIETSFAAVKESLELNHGCGSSFISFIRTIKEFDASEGYFFACNYLTDIFSTGIKLLNSKFEVIKEKYIQKAIVDTSIAKGSETYIGMCYDDEKTITKHPYRVKREGSCDMLDFDLKLKYTIFMHTIEEDNVSKTKIHTLKDGSAWILNNYSPEYNTKHDHSTRITVRHVQADGKSSEPAEILKNYSSYIRLFPFLFEKEYCVVIRTVEKFYHVDFLFPKVHVRGKCFDAATL